MYIYTPLDAMFILFYNQNKTIKLFELKVVCYSFKIVKCFFFFFFM